jgi:hypothetical protein
LAAINFVNIKTLYNSILKLLFDNKIVRNKRTVSALIKEFIILRDYMRDFSSNKDEKILHEFHAKEEDIYQVQMLKRLYRTARLFLNPSDYAIRKMYLLCRRIDLLYNKRIKYYQDEIYYMIYHYRIIIKIEEDLTEYGYIHNKQILMNDITAKVFDPKR